MQISTYTWDYTVCRPVAAPAPAEYMVRAYDEDGDALRYVGNIDTHTKTWVTRSLAHMDMSQAVEKECGIIFPTAKIELYKITKESEAPVEVVSTPKHRLQYWSF